MSTILMMMNPLFLNKRIAASSWRPECSDHSECSVKKAINPTYAQPIVLQKFKGFFIYNMLRCLFNFCRLRHHVNFFGFCVCFSRNYLQVREDFFVTRDVECIQTEDNYRYTIFLVHLNFSESNNRRAVFMKLGEGPRPFLLRFSSTFSSLNTCYCNYPMEPLQENIHLSSEKSRLQKTSGSGS